VLFISSDATVDRKVECFDAGGVDYITKPYQAREVLARLRTHLRLREANKRIAEMTAAQIRDLNRAQKAILPPDPADFPEAKFSAFYRQLSGAGGDFYEIVKLEEKLFDYITFDVCGHDVGGSMVTAALKALFAQNCSILHSPAEILSIVNKAIPSVLQRNQFVAVSWVRLNRNTGKAHIVNSGQPAVIVVSGDGAIDVIDPTGDLIGVFDSAVFETVEKMVKPGDRFLLYSDGLIELGDKTPASRDAKSAKLVQRCRASAGTALPTFVDEIKKVMFGNAEPDDDVVILCFDV
jgi:sigma-B regulation protein RsbU (phosphoserine phosphatase)